MVPYIDELCSAILLLVFITAERQHRQNIKTEHRSIRRRSERHQRKLETRERNLQRLLEARSRKFHQEQQQLGAGIHFFNYSDSEDNGPHGTHGYLSDIEQPLVHTDKNLVTYFANGTTPNQLLSMSQYLANQKHWLMVRLGRQLHLLGSIKFYLEVPVNFKKPNGEIEGEDQYKEYAFHSTMQQVNKEERSAALEAAFEQIQEQVDEFTNMGSGWILDHIVQLRLKISKYQINERVRGKGMTRYTHAGESYILPPGWIRNKKVLLLILTITINLAFRKPWIQHGTTDMDHYLFIPREALSIHLRDLVLIMEI